MVIMCNNKRSVHYGKTMMDIQIQMELENYDFHSWCERAPAMWINIPYSLYYGIKLNETRLPNIVLHCRIDFFEYSSIMLCLCFCFLLYILPLFS